MKIKLPTTTTSELKVVEQKLKCPVCNKDFISDKSLHGHMRKHSDRSWRGMNPPISPEKNDSVHQNQGGSTSFLPRWSNTGRRRRTPGKALNHVSASNTEEPSKKTDDLPLKKRKLVDPIPPDEGTRISAELGDPGANVSHAYKIQIDPRREHTCNICGRCFKSYQALGGHKAHHSIKGDNNLISANEDYEIVHGCEFCGKAFSNGQALGGHKRHCRGPAPENEVIRVTGQECTKNQTTVFSFDLNELPPEWIPEEMENSKDQ